MIKLDNSQKQYAIDNVICVGDQWYHDSEWYVKEYDALMKAKVYDWTLEPLDEPVFSDGGLLEYVLHIPGKNDYVGDHYLTKEAGESIIGDFDIRSAEFEEDYIYESKRKKKSNQWGGFKFFPNHKQSLDMLNHDLTPAASGPMMGSGGGTEGGGMGESLNEFVDPEYNPTITGTAYKVFRIKKGKLYPPMVANPGGVDTPVGVWLQAEEGEFAGLSKTGRRQVKSTGSGTLSYRPGWHLGEVPRASQFDRTNKETGEKEFPKDFVWAKCDYVMDIDYQEESDEQGYMRTNPDGTEYRGKKYQHSLAGLHKIPKDGYYRYRTNPRPDTVPWIITGAIKVTELLDDYQVNDILKQHGIDPIHRQGGDKTLAELGLRN